LFPIVGELNEGKTLIDGKTFNMQRHGFLRKMEAELHEYTDTKAVFRFVANGFTLPQFPFNFEVLVTFELKAKTLVNSFTVKNLDDKTMPFNIGAHPAFAIPFAPNEGIEDCYIEFDQAETASRHLLDDKGLFTKELRPVLSNANTLNITKELFEEDALIFKDLKSRTATIKSKTTDKKLKVAFNEWPYLGIWAKPAAKYVCIEPWIGCADKVGFNEELSAKELMMNLAPNKQKEFSFTISV
jgi:galactose mutarotase-like enzyme